MSPLIPASCRRLGLFGKSNKYQDVGRVLCFLCCSSSSAPLVLVLLSLPPPHWRRSSCWRWWRCCIDAVAVRMDLLRNPPTPMRFLLSSFFCPLCRFRFPHSLPTVVGLRPGTVTPVAVTVYGLPLIHPLRSGAGRPGAGPPVGRAG